MPPRKGKHATRLVLIRNLIMDAGEASSWDIYKSLNQYLSRQGNKPVRYASVRSSFTRMRQAGLIVRTRTLPANNGWVRVLHKVVNPHDEYWINLYSGDPLDERDRALLARSV